MKAFVKVNNNTFPNLNYYIAWEAFNTMGYSVTLFEEKDIDNLDISVDTPVFAGVTVFRKVIDKLGVNYPPFDCYPTILNEYYGRNLRRSTIGVEKEKFAKDGVHVFVKPVLPKQFLGHVWTSFLSLIPLAKIPDDAECWICEPIKIDSEFRAYVHDGEILGVKHYFGDWSRVPFKWFIEEVVKNYKPCPIAYGIDFAVSWKKSHSYDRECNPRVPSEYQVTVVMEVNDGCNLGNYGLDSIHFGEMIVSRWFEIMANHKVEKDIEKACEYFKGSKYEQDYTKEAFDKPITEGFEFSRKDLMLKAKLNIAREESMKSFAEEVKRNLKDINI